MEPHMSQSRTRALLIAAAAVIVVAGSIRLWQREAAKPAPTRPAVQSAMTPVATTVAAEAALRNANLPIANLTVADAGEFVVLRGTADDLDSIARAGDLARAAGAKRVANMIQVRKLRADDDIRRQTERELAAMPSLNDCKLAVSVNRGAVRVSGKVRSTMQEDIVRMIVRRIDGAASVETDLAAF
jgi:osmotically-inducible protein OsmY